MEEQKIQVKGVFQQLQIKIVKKILVDKSFSNKRWKIRQKTILRCLNRKWLNEVDNAVVSLPIKPEIDARELLRIIHWFPNLKYFNDKDDQFKIQLNCEKLETIIQLISSNLDLQQQLCRKQICIPVFWYREIHFKLLNLAKYGLSIDVIIDPQNAEDILDFFELVQVGINVKAQIKIRFSLEDLIQGQIQLKRIQNCLIGIKDKISCLEIYSIDQIFVSAFFLKFFTSSNDKLERLVLHYSFDPRWHKLFSQDKERLIKSLAQVDNVCQYCSPDETDLRLLGQISFTELVISNAGTGTRDDGYFFIVQLQNHVLYPQDITKLIIGHFPVKFFDQIAIQLLSDWITSMSCLTEFQVLNFDDVFISCFENERFKKLKKLVLGNLRSIENFDFLNNLRNLLSLSLEWATNTDQNQFITLSLQTPKLKILILKNCCCIQAVGAMSQLKDFETLKLIQCSVQVSEAFDKELGRSFK